MSDAKAGRIKLSAKAESELEKMRDIHRTKYQYLKQSTDEIQKQFAAHGLRLQFEVCRAAPLPFHHVAMDHGADLLLAYAV